MFCIFTFQLFSTKDLVSLITMTCKQICFISLQVSFSCAPTPTGRREGGSICSHQLRTEGERKSTMDLFQSLLHAVQEDVILGLSSIASKPRQLCQTHSSVHRCKKIDEKRVLCLNVAALSAPTPSGNTPAAHSHAIPPASDRLLHRLSGYYIPSPYCCCVSSSPFPHHTFCVVVTVSVCTSFSTFCLTCTLLKSELSPPYIFLPY